MEDKGHPLTVFVRSLFDLEKYVHILKLSNFIQKRDHIKKSGVLARITA